MMRCYPTDEVVTLQGLDENLIAANLMIDVPWSESRAILKTTSGKRLGLCNDLFDKAKARPALEDKPHMPRGRPAKRVLGKTPSEVAMKEKGTVSEHNLNTSGPSSKKRISI